MVMMTYCQFSSVRIVATTVCFIEVTRISLNETHSCTFWEVFLDYFVKKNFQNKKESNRSYQTISDSKSADFVETGDKQYKQ